MKLKLPTALATLLACSQAWAAPSIELQCTNNNTNHWVGLRIDFGTEEVRYSRSGLAYRDCKEVFFNWEDSYGPSGERVAPPWQIKCSMDVDDLGFGRRVSLNTQSRFLTVKSYPAEEPALSRSDPNAKYVFSYFCWVPGNPASGPIGFAKPLPPKD